MELKIGNSQSTSKHNHIKPKIFIFLPLLPFSVLHWIRMRTFFFIQTSLSNIFGRPSINMHLGVIQNKMIIYHRLCETKLQGTDDPEAAN